jgi:hypothetical protein
MCRHAEVENAPAVVCEHEEHVQDLKSDRRYGKEVDGDHVPNVVIQERPPGLGRRLSVPHHVLGHSGLGNLDAQL